MLPLRWRQKKRLKILFLWEVVKNATWRGGYWVSCLVRNQKWHSALLLRHYFSLTFISTNFCIVPSDSRDLTLPKRIYLYLPIIIIYPCFVRYPCFIMQINGLVSIFHEFLLRKYFQADFNYPNFRFCWKSQKKFDQLLIDISKLFDIHLMSHV